MANKDLFIDKQGNYGSILTGDQASAARYIECRLTPLAKETLHNPQITEYIDSYDGRNKEPVAFPAKIPVLLSMGAEGIASSMATRILPHNLIELMEAQIACLKGEPFLVLPDFPTG
ncbi:MAG TPA: DNA topoisomerase IV subunit A, partial [Candidatus Latescibacteria bacterium]|nr:DNA topoisomerase IV subunit A [Candidatus Latescibacterota bacterium]